MRSEEREDFAPKICKLSEISADDVVIMCYGAVTGPDKKIMK